MFGFSFACCVNLLLIPARVPVEVMSNKNLRSHEMKGLNGDGVNKVMNPHPQQIIDDSTMTQRHHTAQNNVNEQRYLLLQRLFHGLAELNRIN